jgi:DNA invertase Pin-like site-specific DNA recombinase
VSVRQRGRIYIRESKDELARGYSPDEMVRQCRLKADALGADVESVTIEVGKRDEFDCPRLVEHIADARVGQYDYLISYDMYRLSGELGKHLWVKEELAKTGVSIHYVAMEYAPGPEGELMETVQAAVGRYERMKTLARTQNGIAGKLAKHRPICNGIAPYGLVKVRDEHGVPIGYQPDPNIAIVERIVRELAHDTMGAIAARLNAERVPTPSGGGAWRASTIAGILKNPIYGGEYRWGRVKRTPSRHPDGRRKYVTERRPEDEQTAFLVPPVVDLAALAAARSAVAGRQQVRRSRRPDDDDPFALRGRIYCSCGGLMATDINNGYRRYSCQRSYPLPGVERTCTAPQLHAEAVEWHVFDELCQVLGDRDLRAEAFRRATDPDEAWQRYERQVEMLRDEIAKLERRIANAATIMLDFERGSQTFTATLAAQKQAEETKRGHVELLASLERQAPKRVEPDQLVAAERFWEEVAAGVKSAAGSAARQRASYRVLGLRVVIALDSAGVLLGRKHRWSVRTTWSGRLSDSAGDPCGSTILWDSHPDDAARSSLRLVASSAPLSPSRPSASRPQAASISTHSTSGDGSSFGEGLAERTASGGRRRSS